MNGSSLNNVDLPASIPSIKIVALSIFLFSGFIKGREWLEPLTGHADLTLIAGVVLFILTCLTLLFVNSLPIVQLHYFLAFLFFLSFILISFLSGQQSHYASYKLIQLSVFGSLSLLATMVLFKEKDAFLQFFFIIFLLGIFGGLDAIWINPLFALSETDRYGLSYQWASRITFYSIMVGLFYLGGQIKTSHKLFIFFSLFISLLGILFGGGKQGLLAFFVCFIYAIYIKKINGSLRFLRFLGAAFAVLVSIYILTEVLLIHSFFSSDLVFFSSKFLTFYNKLFFSDDVINSVFGERLTIYKESWVFFSDNPILGLGFGGYADHTSLIYKHPHNFVLELLSETGLIGIVIFFLFWKRILLSLFNRNLMGRSSSTTKLIAYLIIGQLAMMQVSGDIGTNGVIFFFGGLFLASLNKDKNELQVSK